MSFGRIALAWTAVATWPRVWLVGERRLARDAWWVVGEALLLTLFGA